MLGRETANTQKGCSQLGSDPRASVPATWDLLLSLRGWSWPHWTEDKAQLTLGAGSSTSISAPLPTKVKAASTPEEDVTHAHVRANS